MAKSLQSYASHTQWTPLFHFVTAPLSFIYLIWAGRAFYAEGGAESGMILLGAFTLVCAVFISRVSTLRVQDRVIRLEERLRFARILPADMQSRIEEIRPGQMVGLRFASDSEAPALVAKVLANPAMTQKEIKMAVQDWRADVFRA